MTLHTITGSARHSPTPVRGALPPEMDSDSNSAVLLSSRLEKMLGGSLHELALTLGLAWLYLTIVRFLDLNEREPVWALATAFLAGALSAGALRVSVSSVVLELDLWTGAAARETAKLAALVAMTGIFAGVARIRGWSELSDALDGLVYGVAVGLGFSVADTFIRELWAGDASALRLLRSPERAAIDNALAGLAHGVFTAFSGLGLGAAAAEAHRRGVRAALVIGGLGAAIVANALFHSLSNGAALSGGPAFVRAWIALSLPVLLLAGIALRSLAVERRAIHRELSAEAALAGDTITPHELALLESFVQRQARYVSMLASGQVSRCLHTAALHNRQVQLALAKRRAYRVDDAHARAALERTIQSLRSAVRQARRSLDSPV